MTTAAQYDGDNGFVEDVSIEEAAVELGMARWIALCLSGRLRVTVATPSARSRSRDPSPITS